MCFMRSRELPSFFRFLGSYFEKDNIVKMIKREMQKHFVQTHEALKLPNWVLKFIPMMIFEDEYQNLDT